MTEETQYDVFSRLKEDAQEWERHDWDDSYLYRGTRLAEAEESAKEHADDLTTLERQFLKASLAAERQAREQAEAATPLRQRTILPTVVGLVAVGMALVVCAIALVALALFWRANQARKAAEYQSRIAQSRALAAYAEDAADQELAVLLGLEAVYQTHRYTPDTMTVEAGSALYRALERSRWHGTLRHKDWVYHAAWSSDSRRIVTSSHDGNAKVWDAQTGQELFILNGQDSWIWQAAWSPDDTRIVTGHTDGRAIVWDAQTGQEITTPRGHTTGVWNVAWSSDGTRIVTAGEDGNAIVWDAQTGKELSTFSGHSYGLKHAAWSPDDRHIITISDTDRNAKVWDAQTGEELFTLSGDIVINYAAWSADGTRIVTARRDRSAKVWDAQTGQELSRGVKCSPGFSFSASLNLRISSSKIVPIVGLSTFSGWRSTFLKRSTTMKSNPASSSLAMVFPKSNFSRASRMF